MNYVAYFLIAVFVAIGLSTIALCIYSLVTGAVWDE